VELLRSVLQISKNVEIGSPAGHHMTSKTHGAGSFIVGTVNQGTEGAPRIREEPP